MIQIIALLIASIIVVYILTFRAIVYILSGGMFAILLILLPDVLIEYVLIDIFGARPSLLLYLLTLGAVVLIVYLSVEKNIRKNRFLDFSLGIGLLAGLFVNVMKLFFAR